ncbi:MAG: hypothetical protein LBD67_10605 [Candidatus Accumulibacter sp.]|nr:hypothetical protein [Accumulibacter sp.]
MKSGWSVRSCFDKLSTNGNRCCRRVRIGKSIYDLKRLFLLRQAQYERR